MAARKGSASKKRSASRKKGEAQYESYLSKADANVAKAIAAATSPFTIEVRFLGGLTQAQKNAFKAAADRWTRVIVGDLPSVMVGGEVIDDLLILAQGTAIDGPGGILGQAGPTHLRPASAGTSAFIPVKGIMSFDTADLKKMEQNGTLRDVITHEMGHVLGIGTIWSRKGLLAGVGSSNPTFTGARAMKEYRTLRGGGALKRVPVENTGGQGTRDSHWRETVFRNELMSGFIAASKNPLSRMTAGSLADLGYAVDMNAAEPYSLPNLMMLAEKGLLAAKAPPNAGIMLTNIPVVVPDDSLQ
ncbi:MAG TPA: leishmanolysin-related zinc metalloendopeptidase [Pyrinomonadaceae bacterium]|nr:leishmanolysin-related zinc metalloendopeptidase [Pyrinomonadaceae bacterium]